MQSQTTFAAIVKDDEGVFQAKVLKQKIWVAGTSYELQEIYGLEQASHAKAREVRAISILASGTCHGLQCALLLPSANHAYVQHLLGLHCLHIALIPFAGRSGERGANRGRQRRAALRHMPQQ